MDREQSISIQMERHHDEFRPELYEFLQVSAEYLDVDWDALDDGQYLRWLNE